MIRVFIILLGLFAYSGCDNDESNHNIDSIEHFRHHLKSDMTLKNLVRAFGKPDNDLGSGIHIYVYNLEDGTKIKIGFTDKILYASHVDENDSLIDVLI